MRERLRLEFGGAAGFRADGPRPSLAIFLLANFQESCGRPSSNRTFVSV